MKRTLAQVAAIVLAAGMGTRMKSSLVKVLHPLCGVPMIQHVLQIVRQAGAHRIVTVVGHQAERVQAVCGDTVEYAIQTEQKGTGHAVLQAEQLLAAERGTILVVFGDTPLYRVESVIDLVRAHQESGAAATVLSAVLDDPTGYGRVIRDADGKFLRIVEQSDVSPDEAAVNEINTGMCCIEADRLFIGLRRLGTDNEQGEYYLPDLFANLVADGERVEVVVLQDHAEAQGINSRRHLAEAEAVLRERIRQRWLDHGVTLIDPSTTFIDANVTIGRDTVIHPFSFLEDGTEVGEACTIGPMARLRQARIGDRAVIDSSMVHGTAVEPGAVVGPHAALGVGVKVPWMDTLERD